MKNTLSLFSASLVFVLALVVPAPAQAQTAATPFEKQVGQTCANGAASADFDTLVQCSATSGAGTMQKAPLFVGAVTAPPYAATTCDANKEGMIQYTGSAMQYCDGTAWSAFGITASGTNAQSMFTGWPDAIVCDNGTNHYVLYATLMPGVSSLRVYRLITLASSSTDYTVSFTAAGEYSTDAGFSGYDCISKNIATLVAEGKAFNMANGQAGGTDEMQNGTAGAPGLFFSADTNTGLYRPTDDTLAIATAGVERLRVTASGYVGIGTMAPVFQLSNSAQTNVTGGFGGLGGSAHSFLWEHPSSDTTAGYAASILNSYAAVGANGLLLKTTDATASTNILEAYSGSSTRFLVRADGNVGIGTMAPGAQLTVSSNAASLQAPTMAGTVAQFGGANTTNARVLLDSYAATPSLDLRRANTTAASPSAVQVGDNLGHLGWFGYNGSAYTTTSRAAMSGVAAENWTTTANGTYISLYTTAMGTTALAEKVRIDPSGNVGIGTAGAVAPLTIDGTGNAVTTIGTKEDRLFFLNASTIVNNGAEIVIGTGDTATGRYAAIGTAIQNNTSGAASGDVYIATKALPADTTLTPRVYVKANGTVGIGTTGPGYLLHVNGTAYAEGAAGALSDKRHKKEVATLKNGMLDVVMKLRPVAFQWSVPKDDGMKGEQIGFIAQEVEQILPQIVLTEKNEEKTKGLKYSEFIPVLTKALQELFEKIKVFESVGDNQAKAIEDLRALVEQQRRDFEAYKKSHP